MKLYKCALLLLIASIFFTSCKKEDKGPQLPEHTHEGKNIIAWKMDGKVFISEGASLFSNNRSRYNISYDTVLYIGAKIEDTKERIYMVCVFKGLNAMMRLSGNYPYRGILSDYSNSAGGTIPTDSNQYQTDDINVGSVIVTYFDSTIIAGTFQMNVVNDDGQVRHITEGRFDISSKQ